MRILFKPFSRSSRTKKSLKMDKSSNKTSALCGIISTQFSFKVAVSDDFINLKLVALSLFV